MNQRSPAEWKGNEKKFLAHGNTLGIMAIGKSPCKGKRFILPFYLFTLLPLKNRQKIFLIFK